MLKKQNVCQYSHPICYVWCDNLRIIYYILSYLFSKAIIQRILFKKYSKTHLFKANKD
jgi:hypothetical protein